MGSIEASASPLVFKAEQSGMNGLQVLPTEGGINVRTATRALAGMQKEAVLRYGDNGPVWRMVCDEGPWLNGTDLAPFPLGFFTAGLVASYMSEFINHAKQQQIALAQLEVMVDNRYSMEGSLLKGSMSAEALPVKVTFRVEADVERAKILELAAMAVSTSPADAYLRGANAGLFSLYRNGEEVPVTAVPQLSAGSYLNPAQLFAQATPQAGQVVLDIIKKLPEVTHLGGDKLGTVKSSADVGLADNQKRQLHVRGVGHLRADGLKSVEVACFSPVGSVFRLLSDDSKYCGGKERAPSGLAYFAAGLSYCFMTQLGRYAQVAKQQLHSYQIVQGTRFSLPQSAAVPNLNPESTAVETQVFVETQEGAEETQTMLRMGEQTCYLHAACRTALKTRIEVS